MPRQHSKPFREAGMNLYRVTLKGMTYSSVGVVYGVSYVVAKDPTSAYKIVRKFLDSEDIGFGHQRILVKVELIAEEGKYPPCNTILFIQGGGSGVSDKRGRE
jgi:hypothetical protein